MTTRRRFAANPTPPLSDEAVIHIHNAIENYLHWFENHHVEQIRRYYDGQRPQHHTPTAPDQRDIDPSDEPF